MARNESFFQRLNRLFRSGPSIQRRIKGYDSKNYYDSKLVQGNYGYRAPAPFGFGRENSPFSVLGSYGILDRMARYAEFCLTGDMRIGTNTKEGSIRLDELVERYQKNPEKKYHTFSYDTSKQEMVLAEITHAFYTKTDEIVEVHLDNGAVLKCTKEHPLMLRDGTYKQVQELKLGMALMPFNRNLLKKYKNNNHYRVIHSNTERKWVAEHKIVGNYILGRKIVPEDKFHVHHKNYIGIDNSISNLEIMPAVEHIKMHALDGARTSKRISKKHHKKMLKNIAAIKKINHNTGRTKKNTSIRFPKCSQPAFSNPNIDKVFTISTIKSNWSPGVTSCDLAKKCGVSYGKFLRRIKWAGYQNYTCFVQSEFDKSYNLSYKHPRKFSSLPTFQDVCNSFDGKITNNKLAKKLDITSAILLTILRRNGFISWYDFSANYQNHKISKIVFTGRKEKVYDITVAPHHNFALYDPTGKSAIISHNSEMEYTPELASALDIYCVASDVEIPLLDGSTNTISELFEQKKENFWVYSFDVKKNRFVPGLCKKVVQTGEHQKIYKINFDDGSRLRLTENHLVLLSSGEYKKVKNLHEEDSVRGVYRKLSAPAKTNKLKDYEMIWQPDGSWQYTHRMASDASSTGQNGALAASLQIMSAKEQQKSHCTLSTTQCKNNKKYTLTSRRTDKEILSFFKSEALSRSGNVVRQYKSICGAYKISRTQAYKVLQRNDYKNWADFTSRINHKIVSIEEDGHDDVFDLQVEGHHNFAAGMNGGFTIIHNSDETVGGDDKGRAFHIYSDNVQIKRALEELFYDVLNVEFNLRAWTRNLVKYGDFFLYNEVLPEIGVINAQPIPVNELEREEGYDEEDPYAVRFKWLTRGNVILENWQVTHFRILGNDLFLPYGTSVLEAGRRIWRQLIMMEDAMLVYRVVRSPERRVFYIDIGNVAPNDIQSYMEAAKASLRSHSVIDRTSGRMDMRYNPLAVDEDYYIPVRGGQSGTKIETLAGGAHVTATEDVEYIQSKLFAAIKVPKPYLNYDENLCLLGGTKIPLLDGNTVAIEDLANMDHGTDNGNFVYSAKNDGSIVSGRIVKAWKTKDVSSYYKITLDSGEVVDCTENHPFMLRDGSYQRADKLFVGQSLMPGYRKISDKADGNKLTGYEMIFDNASQKWVYTHRMVNKQQALAAGGHRVGKARVIHHADFDKRNNNPCNLVEMTWFSHRKLHSMPEHLEHTILSKASIEKSRASRMKWLKSSRHKEISSQQMKHETTTPGRPLYNWIHGDKIKETVSQTIKAAWATPGYRKIKTLQNKEILQRPEVRAKIFGKNHWATRATAHFTLDWLIAFCKEKDVKEYSFFKRSKASGAPCSSRIIQRIFKENNIHGWRHFSKAHLTNNHKIVAIEKIECEVALPVYDLTIENVDNTHNFLLEAGIFVHNSSKATLAQEDIRFSRTITGIQKIIISELNKLAMIHLFSRGFDGEDLVNFTLKLSNPSSVAIQQKLELLSNKADVAGTLKETKLVDERWIQKNILDLTDDDIDGIEKGLYEDRIKEAQLDQVAFESEAESNPTTDPFSQASYKLSGENVPKGNGDEPPRSGGTDIVGPPPKDGNQFVVDYQKGSAAIKATPFLTRNKKNKKRRVTNVKTNASVPNFAKMLNPSKNRSLKDVFDSDFLSNPTRREAIDPDTGALIYENLINFTRGLSLPNEMKSVMKNLSTHLKEIAIKKGILTEELELGDIEAETALLEFVETKNTADEPIPTTLKEVVNSFQEEKNELDEETIEFDLD